MNGSVIRSLKNSPWSVTLAVILVLGSTLGYMGLLRSYLSHSASQFAESFYSQNYPEIESADIASISHRLSRIGNPVNWECIRGSYSGRVFFERNPTNCRERFFRDIVEVRGKGNDGISIIFAVRLPVVVEHFALMFVVVHAALFALLFLTGRRFERVRTEAALRISEITSQVAHDIRSPLAALQVALRSAEGWTSESKELVGSAASRIRSIAEDLLRLDRDRKLPPSVVSDLGPILSARSLDVVLRDLFEEKRREYIDRSGLSFFLELDSDFGSAVTNIEEHAFARMFSNLINNAVESISGVGRVVVAAKQTDKSVDIQIVDNGCGIPAELISTIGKTPFTRKSNGNGLGAVSAMRTVERWAGSITWQRNHSRGITVTISIPRVCSR